ncbi:MAG: cytochrome c biogenesis protein CcsA [Bacteroidetes bacterium]|nr:cytochrome c biogenesis protein CcsA [Bacteroidota bacterium]
MKGLLIGGATVLGIVLGFWPAGLMKPKPAWWRWLAIATLAATVLLGLGVPTGGDFRSAIRTTMGRGDSAPLPVYASVVELRADGSAVLRDMTDTTITVSDAARIIADAGAGKGDRVILGLSFNRGKAAFIARRHLFTNPLFTLPLIPGLEERARNIYFHVPCAWLVQVAWFIACCYALLSIRKRRVEDDVRASAAAALGAVFCVLATLTGAIWAKFNWGEFWNWDPRQTAIFVVMVIYGAYFALRSAIQNDEQRARVSAVYLLLMLIPVVFFLFIYPRMVDGLHPGAGSLESQPLDSATMRPAAPPTAGQKDSPAPEKTAVPAPEKKDAGPILSSDPDALNPIKQVIFSLSFFSFSLLFFWILNVRVRISLLERRREMSRAATTGIVPGPIAEDIVRPS